MKDSSVARKAKPGRRKQLGKRPPEPKNFDIDNAVTATQSGTLTLLSGIAQGTDIGQRIGNSVFVTDIRISGRVAINSAVTTFSTARMVLIRDNENSGAAPVLSDILEATGSTVVTRSPKNYLNRKRFTFLYDELFVLAPGSASALPIGVDMRINREVTYRGTGNTVAAAAEGTLYLLVVSDEVGNAPNLTVYIQYQFTDY